MSTTQPPAQARKSKRDNNNGNNGNNNGTVRAREAQQPPYAPRPSGAPADHKVNEGRLPVTPKYLFSLKAVIVQQFVGETPGGFRIDLAYSAAEKEDVVTTKYTTVLTDPLLEYVTGATLLSGTDWVSVSRQGIVDFDSRITLALGTPEPPDGPDEPCLISARLRGRGNLGAVRDPNGDPHFTGKFGTSKVIADWRSGFETGSTLDVMLAVTADVPLEGFDENQTAVYRQCDLLGSSLLLGRATVTFNKAPFGAVNGIELDVFEL
jgi:hypothetical protein